MSRHAEGTGLFEYPRALPLGRAGQSLDVGQGLDRSGPPVPKRAAIGRAARAPRGFSGIEQPDRRAAGLLLGEPGLEVAQACRRMGTVQRPLPHRLAADLVGLDQVEHRRGAVRQQRVEPPADGLAEFFLHLVRRRPESGVDEAHVAARSAETDAPRLQERHRSTPGGQVTGRRDPGKAASDHHDVDGDRLAQGGIAGPVGRGVGPEAYGARHEGHISNEMPWASGSARE